METVFGFLVLFIMYTKIISEIQLSICCQAGSVLGVKDKNPIKLSLLSWNTQVSGAQADVVVVS